MTLARTDLVLQMHINAAYSRTPPMPDYLVGPKQTLALYSDPFSVDMTQLSNTKHLIFSPSPLVQYLDMNTKVSAVLLAF